MRAMVNAVDAESGGAGQGWLQIATTSEQARTIVKSGKLCVVLGVETDKLGGRATPTALEAAAGVPPGSPQDVKNPLVTPVVEALVQSLRDLGVTHVFPLHAINNAFGGAGLFVKDYDAANYVATGAPFQVEPAPPDGC